MALPADSLTPRLSWVGVLLIVCALALAGSMVALGQLTLSLRESLHDEARVRLRDFESTLAAVQSGFDVVLGDLPATAEAEGRCTESARQRLLSLSLASEHARRYLWLPPGGAPACLPGGNRLPEDFEARLRALRPAALDPVSLEPDGQGSMYLVRHLGNGGVLAAELAAARWRQSLGRMAGSGDTGALVILRDWRGTVLHAENPIPAAGGTADALRWVDPLRERLCQVAFSPAYRLTLEVAPGQRALLRAVGERVLLAWCGALLLSLMLVSSINMALQDRFSIVRRLRRGLRRREFEPVLQPFVEAASGRCIGAEVLMRWRHPIRGLLSPAEFLAIAEQTGLIVDMTWQLLAKSRDRLDPIVRESPGLLFSFNFGVQMLRDPGFIDRLAAIFADSAVRPRNVCIELLERDAVDERSIDMLARLRRHGYKIAIDDFGTGHSSLALLSQIGFDTLKIDREFVRAIDSDSVNRPVLTAIIELAERLGVRTTAEGVETPAQHRFLLAHGVDVLQGYLIARPMPVAEFVTWLSANRRQPAYADGTADGVFGAPVARKDDGAPSLPSAAAPTTTGARRTIPAPRAAAAGIADPATSPAVAGSAASGPGTAVARGAAQVPDAVPHAPPVPGATPAPQGQPPGQGEATHVALRHAHILHPI